MRFLRKHHRVFVTVITFACMGLISVALLEVRLTTFRRISTRRCQIGGVVPSNASLRCCSDDATITDNTRSLNGKRVAKTKKIPRVYIESSSLNLNTDVILPESTSHYISNVMRMKVGDHVRVFNGINAIDFLAEILPMERKKGPVKLQVVSPLAPTAPSTILPHISVIFSPIKKPRLKFLFEKLTELGVSSLIPLITTRTEARFESKSSFQKSIIESCEQCERSSIPSIHNSINLAAIIKNTTKSEDFMRLLNVDRLLVCVERTSTSQPLLSALTDWQTCDERLGLVIGPEGGFSDEEVEYLTFNTEDQDGNTRNSRIVPVSLGSNILRAETAGIFALSCVIGYHESSRITSTTLRETIVS